MRTRPVRPNAVPWRATYGALRRRSRSPMVALNHAGAVGMADGPAAGLALLEQVAGLDDHVLLHAARAELLRRAGDGAEADAAYARAIALTANAAQRGELERRRAARGRPAPDPVA